LEIQQVLIGRFFWFEIRGYIIRKLPVDLVIGQAQEHPKVIHGLDVDDDRHKARSILKLLQHGRIEMKFDFTTTILYFKSSVYFYRIKINTTFCTCPGIL